MTTESRFPNTGQLRIRFYLLLTLVLFSGCPIYTLQKARIGGSVKQTPVGLISDNQPGSVEFIPHISLTPDRTIRGVPTDISLTEIAPESVPDVIWRLPTLSYGLTIEKTFSSHFLGNIGMNYAEVNGEALYGGNVGLGYYWKLRSWAFRVDATVLMQQNRYDVEILRTEEGAEDRTIVDAGRSAFVNAAGSLTVNSRVMRWPVNFVASFQTGNNTFYKFNVPELDTEDRRFTGSYRQVVIGLFRPLGSRSTIVGGFRRTFDHSIKGEDMQLDASQEIFFQLHWKIKP